MRSEAELVDLLTALLSKKSNADNLENEVFELKEAKKQFDFDEAGKYFSALSNEANLRDVPCAWLVFGVADNGTVVGTSYLSGSAAIQEYKKNMGDKTNNRISFIEIYDLMYNGKRVVMLEIPPALRGCPTSFAGISYGRDGSSRVVLSEEKRIRILSQPRFLDWSAAIVPGATLEDLDTDAIAKAREKFITKNPRLANEVRGWSDERFLRQIPLLINGKITRAALVLLGKRERRYLLNPYVSEIEWILKDKDGIVLDYYVGDGPLILEVDEVYRRVRNLKYRYIPEGTLFPEEVDMYEEYLIREPLNNAIAHQDYSLGLRIYLTEMPDFLVFLNAGSFLPGSVDAVLNATTPDERYRNPFLVKAMRELDLIDTAWSGIRRMFQMQREKFFPMPEYTFPENRVSVTIYGKVLDKKYAEILARNGELTLSEILLLDRVQKHQEISHEAAKHLRKLGLIEGYRPNYYLSIGTAQKTGQRAQYTVNRGLDKKYYCDLILAGIDEHGALSRRDINELLWRKLPESYFTDSKKRRKIDNLLAEMKRNGVISPEHKGSGSLWRRCDK